MEYITELHFEPEEIEYLRGLPTFSHVPDGFFDYLRSFRFSGEVWAMPEGTPFFPSEPILRITAPIIEAQLLETCLLSIVNFQTMIASKAARIVLAANGRGIVEFGTRRAHGIEAGLYAARAAYIGGCVGTSNIEAGYRFGIPVSGTMAHSWVMSYPTERAAFKAYTDLFPETAILLLDTYDTLTGASIAVDLGVDLRGVRLDSGDFADLSRKVRRILDDGGQQKAKILASGDLDENSISEMVKNDCPIDLFGVGTMLSTSYDAPALGGVYKLVEQTVDGHTQAKMKLSASKSSYPGKKQVWRKTDKDGYFESDIISADDEAIENAIPLLECVMRNGKVLNPTIPLTEIQSKAKRSVESISADVRKLQNASEYKVGFSSRLQKLRDEVANEIVTHTHK